MQEGGNLFARVLPTDESRGEGSETYPPEDSQQEKRADQQKEEAGLHRTTRRQSIRVHEGKPSTQAANRKAHQ